jgi:hypothetical protein
MATQCPNGPAIELTRRAFSSFSLATVAAAVSGATVGCSDRRDEATFKQAEGLAQVVGNILLIVPEPRVRAVGALIDLVGKALGGIGKTYQPGTLSQGEPQGWKTEPASPSGSWASLQTPSGGSSRSDTLLTPVIRVESVNRILQAGRNFSLVAGGGSAYWVNNAVVDYLLADDTCDLVVAGHSVPGQKCRVPGCNATVLVQDFKYPGGTAVSLQWMQEDAPGHAAHSLPAPNCQIKSRPEKCPTGQQ